MIYVVSFIAIALCVVIWILFRTLTVLSLLAKNAGVFPIHFEGRYL
jgi:hypothetical protein